MLTKYQLMFEGRHPPRGWRELPNKHVWMPKRKWKRLMRKQFGAKRP